MRYRRGDAVWAAFGSYGWSPRYVVKVGPRWVVIGTPTGVGGVRPCGKRRREELRPRVPAMNGKDKPTPLGHEECERIRDLYRARKADASEVEVAPEDK